MEGMKHQVTYLSSDYPMELIHYPPAQISAFLTGIRLRIAGVFLRFLLHLILLYFYFSYNNPQVQMLPLKSYSCSCLFFVARVLQWERVGALHYAKGWRCASVGKCEYEIFHTYFTPPPPPPQIHTQNKPTHITCIILGHCRSLQRWFTASLLKNFKILLDWLQSDSQALRSVFRLQHMII